MKQKYNWVTLNESFFDDIEDDIIDNDNGLNNLYEKSFKECNTINEKVEYLMNMFKVEELFNTIFKYYKDNNLLTKNGDIYNNMNIIIDNTFPYSIITTKLNSVVYNYKKYKGNILTIYYNDCGVGNIKAIYKFKGLLIVFTVDNIEVSTIILSIDKIPEYINNIRNKWEELFETFNNSLTEKLLNILY